MSGKRYRLRPHPRTATYYSLHREWKLRKKDKPYDCGHNHYKGFDPTCPACTGTHEAIGDQRHRDWVRKFYGTDTA